jgi:TRAP-type C4-dicarboxylate transport system substrate-binding protein
MKKGTFVSGFVVIILFSICCQTDVAKLKFANYFPPTHKNSIIMEKYCKELNKRLAGKVEITWYVGGTLLTYQPLMFSTSPPCVVQTLNKPVKTLEDIKGLKIRATGRIADITKSLGATPIPLEMVDVYESFRRGVLEGNLGNFEQMKGFNQRLLWLV